jgi:hypothetical protein
MIFVGIQKFSTLDISIATLAVASINPCRLALAFLGKEIIIPFCDE